MNARRELRQYRLRYALAEQDICNLTVVILRALVAGGHFRQLRKGPFKIRDSHSSVLNTCFAQGGGGLHDGGTLSRDSGSRTRGGSSTEAQRFRLHRFI